MVAVILVATVAADANADDEDFEYAWNVANGTWVTGSNWNPSGPPTASDDIVVKNGGTATIGSGDAAVSDRAYIGHTGGNGTVTMTGGTFVLNQIRVSKASANGTSTGGDTTGTFNLSGGTVTVGEVQVGQGGHGASGMNASTGYLNHSGGTINSSVVTSIGVAATGTYTLSGTGVLNSSTTHVGYGRSYYNQDGYSVGTLTQSTGTTHGVSNILVVAGGWDEIGVGTYNMQGGSLNLGTYGMYMGYAESGADSNTAGYTSSGEFNLSGGTVTLSGNAPIVMGYNAASGTYDINFSGGTLTDGTGNTDLYVRYTSAVGATFKASGGGTRTVDLSGSLVNNGVVKADGTTLNMKSFTAVENWIENGTSGSNGWYAVNSGKLQLDDVAVAATGAQTVWWGEDQTNDSDATIDLVNSVQAQFDNVTTIGDLSVELHANNLAPGTLAANWTTLGLWSIESNVAWNTASGNDASLAFRYDAANVVGNESDLRVWKWDADAGAGGEWEIQHYTLDATNNIITTTGIIESYDTGDYFAVMSDGLIPGDANKDDIVNAADFAILSANWLATGVGFAGGDFNLDGIVNAADFALLSGDWQSHAPEPATMTVLALGGLALLRRRRK